MCVCVFETVGRVSLIPSLSHSRSASLIRMFMPFIWQYVEMSVWKPSAFSFNLIVIFNINIPISVALSHTHLLLAESFSTRISNNRNWHSRIQLEYVRINASNNHMRLFAKAVFASYFVLPLFSIPILLLHPLHSVQCFFHVTLNFSHYRLPSMNDSFN